MTSEPRHEPDDRSGAIRWLTGGRGWSGVAQFPNPAIAIWMVTVVVRWTGVVDDPALNSKIGVLGDGALLVWAVDELIRGVSPIRRIFGVVVLTMQLVRLFG